MASAQILKPDSEGLDRAAKIIRAGGIVVFPTETCYGIAADATDPNAVEKVFNAKGREREKAIPVIVTDENEAAEHCELSPLARALMHAFMPGPLTLVVPQKRGRLAPNLSQAGTVAFRIPGSQVARDLARRAGRPLTSTSANKADEPAIYDSKKAAQALGGVDAIIDAGQLEPNPPSTIVDASGPAARVVRSGELAEKVARFISDYSVQAQQKDGGNVI